MTFRIAIVQPVSHRPPEDERPHWQRPKLYDVIHPRPLREAAE
jgi:hypothetical protein